MAVGEIPFCWHTTADPQPLFEVMRIGCLHKYTAESIYTRMENRARFLEWGWLDGAIAYLIIPYEFGGGLGRILENLHYWRIYSTIALARRSKHESRTH